LNAKSSPVTNDVCDNYDVIVIMLNITIVKVSCRHYFDSLLVHELMLLSLKWCKTVTELELNGEGEPVWLTPHLRDPQPEGERERESQS